jgi:poly-gamma-glutamate capsule biosynthesis protein CapA/YwtB (metallophosphatase superfamily)
MYFLKLRHRIKALVYCAGFTAVFSLSLFCCSSFSDPHHLPLDSSLSKKDSISEVKLLFAGDIMMHGPELEAQRIDSVGGYDFSSIFQFVSPIIKDADIAVANLETTFGGKPYTGYPQFSSPDTLGSFLKNAGFSLMVCANNHAADRSSKGVYGTIEELNKVKLAHTGTFKDSAERAKTYPYIIDRKGIKIAFLNYTYGTNGIVIHPPAIINYIDTTAIIMDIQAAKKQKTDAIIVVFHWGIEYQRVPNEEQKKIARFCLSHGIDVVIGSHPHVVQPAYWEKFRKAGDSVDKKGLVLYSLGNFVSNQRQKYTDGGIIFSFTIRKNKKTKNISVINPEFLPTWVYISSWPKKYYILPANSLQEDTTLVTVPALRNQMLESFNSNRNHMLRDSTTSWLKELK